MLLLKELVKHTYYTYYFKRFLSKNLNVKIFFVKKTKNFLKKFQNLKSWRQKIKYNETFGFQK